MVDVANDAMMMGGISSAAEVLLYHWGWSVFGSVELLVRGDVSGVRGCSKILPQPIFGRDSRIAGCGTFGARALPGCCKVAFTPPGAISDP